MRPMHVLGRSLRCAFQKATVGTVAPDLTCEHDQVCADVSHAKHQLVDILLTHQVTGRELQPNSKQSQPQAAYTAAVQEVSM